MAHSKETIERAKELFINTHKPEEIAARLKVSERTIFNWINKFEWESLVIKETPEMKIARRIGVLTDRDNKTKEEVLELGSLCKFFGSMQQDLAKAEKIMAEARAIDRGEPEAVAGAQAKNNRRNNRNKKKTTKNDIGELDLSKFDKWAEENLFEYQKLWFDVARDPNRNRTRFILKSRQIGATYYFAWEAFENAVRTGDNQLFISASKPQARVFKSYIQAFALEVFDIELKGQDKIELTKNGKPWATLHFLSTNSSSAQSYHGHLYVDEVFWIHGYEKLQLVASGMASQERWRTTYFSTPSSIQHPAYEHWSGKKYNKGRKKKVDIDISDKLLKQGSLGADNIWRHLVTVEDAERMGCKLFNIARLKDEYNKPDFNNLFGCKFTDDTESVFPFKTLKKCMHDIFTKWKDVDFESDNPCRNRPVAIGYDPSRVRDNAALVVIEIPMHLEQKWRVIETYQFTGYTSQYQAARIREIYDRFDVAWCGIDVTGIGYDTYQSCLDLRLQNLIPIHYSLEAKTDLVTRGKRLIDGGRFEYDEGNKDLTQSLMMISQITTANNAITYGASRQSKVGHADLAWATFHGMQAERQFPKSKLPKDATTSTYMAMG